MVNYMDDGFLYEKYTTAHHITSYIVACLIPKRIILPFIITFRANVLISAIFFCGAARKTKLSWSYCEVYKFFFLMWPMLGNMDFFP